MEATQTQIKVSELRIGNWIYGVSDRIEYVAMIVENGMITTNHIKIDSPFVCDIKHISPIPLTPEILEKAGFKAKGSGFWNLEKDFCSLEVYINDKSITTFSYNWEVAECQNLHQLQNLYFALTGEELNIEL